MIRFRRCRCLTPTLVLKPSGLCHPCPLRGQVPKYQVSTQHRHYDFYDRNPRESVFWVLQTTYGRPISGSWSHVPGLGRCSSTCCSTSDQRRRTDRRDDCLKLNSQMSPLVGFRCLGLCLILRHAVAPQSW